MKARNKCKAMFLFIFLDIAPLAMYSLFWELVRSIDITIKATLSSFHSDIFLTALQFL